MEMEDNKRDKSSEEEASESDQPEEQEEMTAVEKFGQKAVMNTEQLEKRLYEVKKSFYNRLESAKLIKK